MADTEIQIGKRYRITNRFPERDGFTATHEGRVTTLIGPAGSEDRAIIGGSGGEILWTKAPKDEDERIEVTVERLRDPLPQGIGSVVRLTVGSGVIHFMRSRPGAWVSAAGTTWDDNSLSERDQIEVLFEAAPF